MYVNLTQWMFPFWKLTVAQLVILVVELQVNYQGQNNWHWTEFWTRWKISQTVDWGLLCYHLHIHDTVSDVIPLFRFSNTNVLLALFISPMCSACCVHLSLFGLIIGIMRIIIWPPIQFYPLSCYFIFVFCIQQQNATADKSGSNG
jgi:hypothetical protein